MRRRVIIADDEPLARARLRALLAAHPQYEIVRECEDGPQAMQALGELSPDVVFLDIRMPGVDGLTVANAIDGLAPAPNGSVVRPVIVFVTAFDEYAVRAFDASATDYLRKPFDNERFARTMARVTERFANPHAAAALDPQLRAFLETLQAERALPERFLIKARAGDYFVRVADIDWVDAQANYVRLHAGGRTHLVRETLKAFEVRLDPRRFVRVNRSAIINIDRVERIHTHDHGEYQLKLRDGTRLTSSRNYGSRLHELLG